MNNSDFKKLIAFIRPHLATFSNDVSEAGGVIKSIISRHDDVIVPNIQRGVPKICIELVAHARGYKQALKTWQNFNFGNAELVYVGYLWNRIGRRLPSLVHGADRTFAGPFLDAYCSVLGEHRWTYILTQYPTLVDAISNTDFLDRADIVEKYDPIALQIEDDSTPFLKSKPLNWRMYYCWSKAHKLALQHAGDADIFITIRPDLYLANRFNMNWKEISVWSARENVLLLQFPRKFLPTGGPYGCGDQLGIGALKPVTAYADTFSNTEEAFSVNRYGYSRKWEGHENVAFSTFHAGVRTVDHPSIPTGNPVLDPPPLTYDVIRRCILQELKWRSRTPADERLLAALG